MTWHHHPPPFQAQIPPGLAPLSISQAEAAADDQTSAEISPNGEFLLQLLKSGGAEEQQQQDSSQWQLQDPAVAALGPSHSFPLGPEVPPPHHPHFYAPPPPLPQPRFGGWSNFQQQDHHLFPPIENPFLTPTDLGFIRPFALQVERPFHPPVVPFPFPPFAEPDAFRSVHEQKLRPAIQHGQHQHQHQHQHGSGLVYGGSGESKLAMETQRQLTLSVAEGALKDDKNSSQQFFGNGAELLQLLQGGPGRVKSVAKTEGLTENGEAFGCASKASQRGSPSTAHGPIGPPRRQVVSPPQSPNDLLGRMWAALPPSSQALYIEQEELKADRETSDAAAAASAAALERKLSDDAYGFRQEPESRAGSPGFSLLKRGAASNMPLDGFEHHDSRTSEKFKAQTSNSTSGRSPEGSSSRGRYVNGDLESYAEESRGISRPRRGNGRAEAKRGGGGRGVVGQWVAVNERNKEPDSAPDSSSCGDYLDGKDEAAKSSNGIHRDELKRRKKQQQEWRIKSDSKTVYPTDKKPDYRLRGRSLAAQLEHPGLPSGSTQDSAVGAALDESKQRLYNRLDTEAADDEELTSYVASLDLDDHENGSLHREGKGPELQKLKENRYRESRRYIHVYRRDPLYRPDLQKLTRQLMGLYNDLIPTEEEEVRRRTFLCKLDSLVERELPGARLFLFGSCANAFGVRNSDIDVCLTVDEEEPNKAELVMKMATILESDDMLNVQALTHARVPIVKFTEPVTGISCDICVNNMLAVVNSKLLHDYAQIDVRLRQLAFMVKHWAKRRQVNETYRGTLSSYAYVLMCIHFLQQRRPPILPCLQDMPATYEVRVGHIRCSYFDHVEKLRDFGADNKETLGELLTSFFDYWAYRHNYNHAVISVRTGGYLSKDEKEWTRRIGNERHLICIEDPFEVSHDLGRVVDKHSIKALREEFRRAADTIASNFSPAVALFEPYIPSAADDH